MAQPSRTADCACNETGAGSKETPCPLSLLEDSLDGARKLAKALTLMGLGMSALGNEDGSTVLGVAELLVKYLQDADAAHNRLRAAVKRQDAP